MKKYTLLYIALILAQVGLAQENVYPAKKQDKPVFISNGTVHIGNGTVSNNTSVEISDGKIVNVGTGINPSANAIVIDAKGPIVALLCCVTIAILALSATIALDRTVRASR